MTERLADITARIDGIGQLGAVVNAMRGIAGARAQQARNQLAAIDRYTETIASAIGRVLALAPRDPPPGSRLPRAAVLAFCAEEGFAGNFSERVLDALGPDAGKLLFLAGSRGAAIAASRGIRRHGPARCRHIRPACRALPIFWPRRSIPGSPPARSIDWRRYSPLDARQRPGDRAGRAAAARDGNARPAAGPQSAAAYLAAPVLLDQLTADYVHAASAMRRCTPSPPRTRRASRPWPPPAARSIGSLTRWEPASASCGRTRSLPKSSSLPPAKRRRGDGNSPPGARRSPTAYAASARRLAPPPHHHVDGDRGQQHHGRRHQLHGGRQPEQRPCR